MHETLLCNPSFICILKMHVALLCNLTLTAVINEEAGIQLCGTALAHCRSSALQSWVTMRLSCFSGALGLNTDTRKEGRGRKEERNRKRKKENKMKKKKKGKREEKLLKAVLLDKLSRNPCVMQAGLKLVILLYRRLFDL